MNRSNLLNETGYSNCLLDEITSTEPFKILINVFRFGIMFLYVFWLILALWIKEFQNRRMIYLINISACSIYASVSGIVLIFLTTCTNEPPDMATCLFINLNNIFAGYYTGYALSALAVYRMICSYSVRLNKWLQWKFILPTLAFTWLFPFSLAFIQLFAFNSRYYNDFLHVCSYEVSIHLNSFLFYILFAIVIPNVIILTSYLMVNIKLRNLKKRSGSYVPRLRNLEPPRITIQLIIYIIMFEVGCVARLLLQFQRTSFVIQVSKDVSMILQVLKWFPSLCPLGLLYFHPELLKKYKKIFGCK